MVRGLILILVQMIFASYMGAQGCILMFVFFIAFWIAKDHKPYVSETLNNLESLSLLSCVVVMLCGVAFHVNELGLSAENGLGFIIIIVVISVMLLISYHTLTHLWRAAKKRAKSAADEEAPTMRSKSLAAGEE